MAPVCKPPHNRGQTFILEWRNAAHMTQKQIAKALQVKQSTISKLETGKSPYEQDLLERLAVLLKATPADLISRRPGVPSEDLEPPLKAGGSEPGVSRSAPPPLASPVVPGAASEAHKENDGEIKMTLIIGPAEHLAMREGADLTEHKDNTWSFDSRIVPGAGGYDSSTAAACAYLEAKLELLLGPRNKQQRRLT